MFLPRGTCQSLEFLNGRLAVGDISVEASGAEKRLSSAQAPFIPHLKSP